MLVHISSFAWTQEQATGGLKQYCPVSLCLSHCECNPLGIKGWNTWIMKAIKHLCPEIACYLSPTSDQLLPWKQHFRLASLAIVIASHIHEFKWKTGQSTNNQSYRNQFWKHFWKWQKEALLLCSQFVRTLPWTVSKRWQLYLKITLYLHSIHSISLMSVNM